MCPPLYYRQRVEERERALSQWRGLYRLLHNQLDVDVDLLEPRPGLPGLAHVASGGFVIGDTFIASRSPHAATGAETEPLENFFLVRGYDIKHLEREVRFEGNRDIIDCNGTLFTGFHFGEAPCAHEEIQSILGSEVVGLELADDWRCPLATGLCPVGADQALFCATAFSDEGREKLESRIPRLVPVERNDGGAIICDSLVVGKDLIMAEGHRTVQPALESLGLTVHELPMAEYSGEGGPRSLALQLG